MITTDTAPLPWRTKEGIAQIDIWHAEEARVVSLHYLGDIPAQVDAAHQRATYIVHAANAYPMLVEALQSSRKLSPEWARSVDALLRELGELS